jgi:protein involved in polysaccharide export with SLBB domain
MAILVLPFLLTGCSSGGAGLGVETEVVPYTEEQLAAREEAKEARYRIREGDELRLSFKYEPKLDQDEILVLPDGYISPEGLNGPVKAEGRTIEELDEDLTAQYAMDIRDPELSVIVRTVSDPQVYVLGEVNKPGLYKMPENGLGVIQAISMAGGYTDDAKRSYTAILRATDEGFMIRSVDLSGIEHVGFASMDYFDLQMYDVIYVPRSSVGNFKYYSNAIFGSALNITRFFWDIYALANIDKIDRIVR